MNLWEFIAVAVLIGAIGKVVTAWLASRGIERRHGPDPETLRAQDEVRQLKDRIQVLERVITDNHGSRRLDDEIERLRDR